MKGIIQQIEEHYEESKNKEPLTIEQIISKIQEAEKAQIKNRIENEKKIKENIKHLNKRSKELGKAIPPVLIALFSVQATPLVGTDFINHYKEWL